MRSTPITFSPADNTSVLGLPSIRAYLRRIVQKKNRLSSGCGPMVVAEHSAEALSALNRVMG